MSAKTDIFEMLSDPAPINETVLHTAQESVAFLQSVEDHIDEARKILFGMNPPIEIAKLLNQRLNAIRQELTTVSSRVSNLKSDMQRMT